ncbi:MAG TPA: MIP/aquaporin family protein [Pyrinomonadaceae bacterium]|jgi:glycerol uptake facilitator-like aquaporin|nr:MIP/aquaporin family protein [Pyrinomonadaceae bacterium]
MRPNLLRRAVAEFTGTAFLLAAIIGSGIMGERLAAGNAAITLLVNSLAVGAVLIALISAFEKISGAHFNPAITISAALIKEFKWSEVPVYLFAQIAGAFVGVGTANLMFDLPLFFASTKARAGSSQLLSEFIATFGLLAVIWCCSRLRPNAIPLAVGTYIVAAFWFTASTSFANPAVTLARSVSDTFAGIRPGDVLPFIGVQFLAAIAATLIFRWLLRGSKNDE